MTETFDDSRFPQGAKAKSPHVSFCSNLLRLHVSVLGDTVIYLDEQIATHRKILQAGKLLGDASGGRMAALGLFVAAIGYARSHLTDGIVPDEFLQEASRNSDAIISLRKAKLIRKLRGSRWLIHDYLSWNPSAAEVQRERELTKQRQRNFRRKSTGFAQGRNGVTSAKAKGEVTLLSRWIPNPRSPIPDPVQKEQGAAPVRSVSPPTEVPKREQRPDGRNLSPRLKISETQKAELTKTPAADGNFAVIEKLAHTVLDDLHPVDPEAADVVETLKAKCASLKIDYATDPQLVRRALASAARTHNGNGTKPLASLVDTVRAGLAAQTLPQTIRALAAGGRRR